MQVIFLILLVLFLILQYYAMHHFFSDSKSVNNLKILVSHSNKWFDNLSLLFSVSPFSLFTSFILSFADSLNSLSFSKSYHFLQNLYLSSKVVKPTSYFSNISLISSSSTFYFPFVSFFISFISCSLSNFRFLSHSIYFLNLLVYPYILQLCLREC